ncbi:hypothetical protein E2320_006282, partial [Naja naja]
MVDLGPSLWTSRAAFGQGKVVPPSPLPASPPPRQAVEVVPSAEGLASHQVEEHQVFPSVGGTLMAGRIGSPLMTFHGELTKPLMTMTIILTFGSSFQYGYNLWVVNHPAAVIQDYYNITLRMKKKEHQVNGIFSCAVPLYLAEIAPRNLRGGIVAMAMIAIGVGVLFSQILGLHEFLGSKRKWAILLSLTGILAVFQLLLLPNFPESPLLRVLRDKEDVEEEIEELHQEDVAEMEEKELSVFSRLTYKGLRKQIISVILLMAGQQFSGVNAVYYYAETIYRTKWLNEYKARYISIVSSTFILLTLLFVHLLCLVDHNSGASGPLPNIIIAELFLQSSRSTGIVLGGFVHWFLRIITGIMVFEVEVRTSLRPNRRAFCRSGTFWLHRPSKGLMSGDPNAGQIRSNGWIGGGVKNPGTSLPVSHPKGTMMTDNYISLVCSMLMIYANLQHGFIFAMFSRFFIGISMVIGVQLAQIFAFPELLGTVEGWPVLVSLPGLLAIWQILLLPSCPESPRYLLMQKKEEEEAREVLKHLRLQSAEDELEELRREDLFEKDEKKMNTLRLLGYRPLRWNIYLYVEEMLYFTGLSHENARYFQMMNTGLLILAILFGMYIVDRKGRKTQLLVAFGMATVFCLVFTVTRDLQ